MEDAKNKFLGTEKVGKLLKMFAIPCVLSLIIQALYNIVDQIFIGNCPTLGQYGNTATGIIYPLTVIALAIALLLGDGTASCISINQGKNDTKNTNKIIGGSITVGFVVSIIFVAIGFIFKNQIIRAFGASDVIFPYASEYANWIIAGFPFFILSTILNPIIRADGSPKYAMFAMAIGAFVNVILDPIFIFVFDMGMTGAALATFIAQVVSFIFSCLYLFKAKSFKLSVVSFFVHFGNLKFILKLGISSFLTQISIVVVSVVNNNILFKYLPNDASAIGLLTIAFKVFGIVISVIVGISCGGQPILGYNYGAGKYNRVKETYKYIMLASIISGVIATIVFEFCPSFIFKIFGYSDVGDFGIKTFKIYLSFILFTCLTKSTSIFFQAIGSPVKAAVLSLLRDFVVLVPLAIILPVFGGIDLFLWSAPISDIVTFVVMLVLIIPFIFKLKNDNKELSLNNASILKSTKGKIITISREHGEGGREIALNLANTLHIPFYDKEIGLLVAKESGLSSEYIDNLEKFASSVNIGLSVNQIAIQAQTELLQKIADNGSCVILGRAGNSILKNYNLCKVFIYAPMEYKVKRIMNNYGDDEKTAAVNIEKTDRKRAKFYSDFTGDEWGNIKNYNLCLDGSVGIEKCVETIKTFIRDKQ